MSIDEKYRREVEKRLLNLEKIVKEIFEHIELLKLLLAHPSSRTDSEAVTIEMHRESKEPSPPNCLHYFGYLRFIPRNESIPEECLVCEKVVECFKHVQ